MQGSDFRQGGTKGGSKSTCFYYQNTNPAFFQKFTQQMLDVVHQLQTLGAQIIIHFHTGITLFIFI